MSPIHLSGATASKPIGPGCLLNPCFQKTLHDPIPLPLSLRMSRPFPPKLAAVCPLGNPKK